MRCAIINDYNLNRVAELQGIKVLNINEFINAVKSVVFLRRDDGRIIRRKEFGLVSPTGRWDHGCRETDDVISTTIWISW